MSNFIVTLGPALGAFIVGLIVAWIIWGRATRDT